MEPNKGYNNYNGYFWDIGFFMTFSWFTLVYYAYWAVLIYVTLQIIHQYTISSRASAWLFTVYLFPVVGLGLYFIFGVKRKKRKMFKQKLTDDQKALEDYQAKFDHGSTQVNPDLHPKLKQFYGLSKMVFQEGCSRLTGTNLLQLLENGEQKFPQLIADLKAAKQTIHMEYYTFKFDQIGYQLAEIMIQKAKQGVKVRFIYDDYGSLGIEKSVLQRMRSHGIEAHPFSEIRLFAFADRLNYRNHRKIVVIDDKIGYLGGINVADDYVNQSSHDSDNSADNNKRFWRDTHVRIEGHAVAYIQNIFLNDWNFCAEQNIHIEDQLSGQFEDLDKAQQKLVQVVSSGPDSPQPSILFSLLFAIHSARDEILITTPYFIPNPALLKALKIAVLSGVKVKLLVPETSDSWVVDAAAQSYYFELLEVGVEIYKYTHGFIHAKTMVVDGFLSILGTANFDERSFELNFEINVLIYDEAFAQQVSDSFSNDLKQAKQLIIETWQKRSAIKIFIEKVARLVSPIL
jgi:cardiolipin synthase